MFLYDKYQVKTSDDVYFHNDIIDTLKEIASDDSLPNIIFYGPTGSGKKTLINILLKLIYGDEVFNTKIVNHEIKSLLNTFNINTIQSLYHINIDIQNNNLDKYIIQQLVTYQSKYKPLNGYMNKKQFKIIVIHNIEKLSEISQMTLRKTMESMCNNCRFIFTCDQISQIIEPIKSRNICIKINAPSNYDLLNTILNISYKENYKITLSEAYNIIKESNNNIKKCLILLEHYIYKIPITNEYNNNIKQIIQIILSKTPKAIEIIQEKINKIIITNISGSQIISDLLFNILSYNIDMNIKKEIIKLAAKFGYQNDIGRYSIIHITSFIENLIILLS